jgi:hypothetical protein
MIAPHLEMRPLDPAGGRSFLNDTIRVFAATGQSLLVLGDADRDCPVTIRSTLEHQQCHRIEIRLAVREADAWLLGDPGIADYLKAPRSKLPRAPESLADPKEELIRFASRSKAPNICREMKRKFPSQSQPPGYNRIIPAFVREHWDPFVAADRCDSLRRCVNRLRIALES